MMETIILTATCTTTFSSTFILAELTLLSLMPLDYCSIISVTFINLSTLKHNIVVITQLEMLVQTSSIYLHTTVLMNCMLFGTILFIHNM